MAWDGLWHKKGYFDLEELAALERAVEYLFRMQIDKIKEYRGLNFFDALAAMEENDKEALYQVQKWLAASQDVRSFFAPALMSHCAEVLKVDFVGDLLLEGPALFVSRPNTTRLLYKWHSEAHYYPKRRKFLNLWFPIFTDRTRKNGAMEVKLGSHLEHWDFAEYNDGPNTFVQYEVPGDWVEDYETYTCESKRGDLIMFDRNLVHRSCVNKSKNYAFAMVARVWCPADDLTLSGNMAATPYGGDIGRAGLIVAPPTHYGKPE